MTTNRFFPRFRYITDISNEQHATVTFSDTHDFVLHEIVSFRVSKPYGMVEINNRQGKVLSIGDFTIVVDIDTLFFNAFIYPVSGETSPPVGVPVGSGVDLANQFFVFDFLSDAFDNVRV